MTCQECQPLAIDLARGMPPFGVGGAVQRADVLSHVATCKRCAQWLREQEALSDALRAAAEADASLAAPPGVEANVMAAWRARQAQRPLSLASAVSYADGSYADADTDAAKPARADDNVVRAFRLERLESEPLANRDRTTHRVAASTSDRRGVGPGVNGLTEVPAWRMATARAFRPAWPAGRAAAFAAAATIVIAALTLASLRWLSPSSTVNVGTNNATGVSAGVDPRLQPGAAGSPVAGRSGERAGGPEAARVTGAGTNAAVVEVLPDKGTKTTKGRPARPRALTPHAATTTARASTVARGASEFSGPAFVLLPYVEPLRPTEMRHIMRVRMPRAQLASEGLQAASADDAVLADVLVGEDGTARAVRIVQ
jgi:hypothetical protein